MQIKVTFRHSSGYNVQIRVSEMALATLKVAGPYGPVFVKNWRAIGAV